MESLKLIGPSKCEKDCVAAELGLDCKKAKDRCRDITRAIIRKHKHGSDQVDMIRMVLKQTTGPLEAAYCTQAMTFMLTKMRYGIPPGAAPVLDRPIYVG